MLKVDEAWVSRYWLGSGMSFAEIFGEWLETCRIGSKWWKVMRIDFSEIAAAATNTKRIC